MLNFTPVNPSISKCDIKVCYVGQEPNRNKSVITKEVATEMAKSLPGSPIVGFYNKNSGDFEEHNRMIDVSNGKFDILDTTTPYGFVSMDAKVWFQKFLDDGVEHEYLCTEGYLWTDAYPDCKRVIEKGNNQSMELGTMNGEWTFGDKGIPEFFIVSDAVIQKLCILGENVEPCFEGASIAAQFSFDGEFKQTLFSMIKELQETLQKGGNAPMENENKTIEVEEADAEFKKKTETEEKEEKETPAADDTDSEKEKDSASPDSAPADDKKDDSDSEEEDKKKKPKDKHSLTEEPEYQELLNKFNALQESYNELEKEIVPLREFKTSAERKEKEAMIDSFYMLSDEDKKNVKDNIDKFSLHDIEAELSILCVRNKVNFNLDDDKNTETEEKPTPMVFSLTETEDSDTAPAWIKAVRSTEKNLK